MTLSAAEAAGRARHGDVVIGWKLDPNDRHELLERFPPTSARTVADHGTLVPKVARDSALPGETAGEIVGRADDGDGVEAMVVTIAGTTERPGGGT